jgi:hypothetical protein
VSSWRVILTSLDGIEEEKGASAYKQIAVELFSDEQGKAFRGQLELLSPNDVVTLRVMRK